MKLKIFYCWQTTTNTKFNKNFIFNCIEKSVKNLKRRPEFKNVDFIILDGIRGEPGSPSVASKITDDRIPNCDIFIADLSVVNYIAKFKQVALRVLGEKFKPFQNNNVINEYGVASNAIGVARIIGVLNSYYGSPNENPDNIPFDLRHLRFPIEYNYSEKNEDKEGAQKQLVDALTDAIKVTSLHVLQFQKNKFSPFSVWSDWENKILIQQKFISNNKTDEIKKLVLNSIKNTKQTLRILGLSGLGKTRTLLEIFRPDSADESSVLLSSRVLYINCNLYPNADYQAIINKITNEQSDYIVILDNCSMQIHRQLFNFTNQENNKLSFITLDSSPEEIEHDKINGVNYIIIKKEELLNVVNEILERDFSNIGVDNIEKIKDFSQGIPLMAVLLGESVKNGEKFIGKLDDKELLDKLLGPKGQEEKHRKILKSCAIFNYFGYYEDLTTQLEFIAKSKNITSLDGNEQVIINDFNELCEFYLKREIFEKRGRFIGMRPFPLAMSLAQEWLEPCTPKRLVDVITEIAQLAEPDRSNLSEALAEQMKYLGYNDKAVEIIDKIVGPDSPFDNAEVLNTELGSRLFRSFVEVNPIAVSNNLSRIFSLKTEEELLNINEGRRNLIWVLEKLCFDKRTFNKSIKVLYSFAVAENETWSNNATGQFLHLFNILLAGTESKLNDRWKVIEWGMSLNNEKYHALAISAMKVGLKYGNFNRMLGAEKQGSKILQDNEPTWGEIKEYWTNILNKLVSIIEENNKYSASASEIVANSIRNIFSVRMGDLILPYVETISRYKKFDWDDGLSNLKFAKKYEQSIMTSEILEKTNELIKLLTKNDFITRYLTLSSSYRFDDDMPSEEERVLDIEKLAKEFIDTNVSWLDSFPVLYKNQHFHAFYFGKQIYEIIKNDTHEVKKFIIFSINVITNIPRAERNVTVLGGFILEASRELKDEFYTALFNSEELNYLLFYFVALDSSGKNYFDMLFELIDIDKSKLSNFSVFSYSNALTYITVDELTVFCDKLFVYGEEGFEIAFDLLFNVGYNDENKKQSLLPLYKKCIYRLGVNKETSRQFEKFNWTQIILFILNDSKEVDFAKFINKSIIDSIDLQNQYHFDYDVQRIYEVLMKDHFVSVWPDLSKALLFKEKDYLTYYGLKHILGSHIGGVGRLVGILFDGDIEIIFNWCDKEKPLAPARVSELAPIFNGNNSNYSEWHPIALRLINEYGDITDVLRSLSSNMGTYSWTGSIVALLEAKKKLFETLIEHPIDNVRKWALSNISYLEKDIEVEKNRDAEYFLH